MPVNPTILVGIHHEIDKNQLDSIYSDLIKFIGHDRLHGGFQVVKEFLPENFPSFTTVINVDMYDSYYGPGYERGYWPTIASVLEFLRHRFLNSQVWYGPDCEDLVTEMTDESMKKMWSHWAHYGYRSHEGTPKLPSIKLNLLVLRCKNIENSRIFYECLGIIFSKEKHGNGVEHYSSSLDGLIFELYPAPKDEITWNSRIGFRLNNIDEFIPKLEIHSQHEFDGHKIYVVVDPDGRKVEISGD